MMPVRFMFTLCVHAGTQCNEIGLEMPVAIIITDSD
jgi:hypothetical protein